MIQFLADENLNAAIVSGLQRARLDADILDHLGAGTGGFPDPLVLEAAARLGRVLISHDVSTMSDFALARVARGERMPGVVIVGSRVTIGRAIDDLAFIHDAGQPDDFANRVLYLPL